MRSPNSHEQAKEMYNGGVFPGKKEILDYSK